MYKNNHEKNTKNEDDCFFDSEENNEAKIELTIDKIENIIRNESFLIKFIIEHENKVLGKSEWIKIDSSFEDLSATYDVNFSVELLFSTNDSNGIAPLVSSPVLIKVLEIVNKNEISIKSSVDLTKKKGKKIGSNESSRRESIIQEEKLMGLCNVDLIPVILGETIFEEKLVLESPSYTWDDSMVSWSNQPRITITVKRDEYDFMAIHEPYNFLNITIESIYNLPLFFTQDNLDYKCGTVLSTNNVEDTKIIFNCGKLKRLRDVEQMKSWKALENIESRARFSKYKINCDYESVKSPFKKEFDLKSALERNEKRIEWNTMHRSLLDAEDLTEIMDHLKKNKSWPFEIAITEKKDEDENREVNDDCPEPLIYQFYVDVRRLLFPGATRIRVLTQLYTQSLSEMREKTGLSVSIFDKRSENLYGSEYEYQGEVESFPFFTECGKPVLILIEFELYRPLIAAQVLEDYNEAIEALKKKTKPKGSFYAYTPDLVHDQYVECINQLIDVFGESYRDFVEECDCEEISEKKSKCPEKIKKCQRKENNSVTCPYYYIKDELSRFKQYLHETGKYASIRNYLKNKIINLLDQKFAFDSQGWYSTENQNFVASCYTYLVEQMHATLNTKLDVRSALIPTPRLDETPFELFLRAQEAYEFDDFEKADKLFTKLVSDDRKNPEVWICYASYFMRKNEINEAIECCRLAIELNSRHKIALLFYGILLVSREEFTDAEVFFKAMLQLYPRFLEGWTVLHLFYVKTQYYPGIDLTLDCSEKCLNDHCQGNDIFIDNDSMSWSSKLYKKNRVFHTTALLLLKLNLYEFAAMAMTQELCQGDRTVEFLYFMGLIKYLQRDYVKAIDYLKEAETTIGLEYSIATLLGHSFYKSKMIKEAITNYESVDMMYDRPENVHLVHVRLGFYYIEIDNYERARNVFSRATRYSPITCKTWLGLGIANYHLKNYEEVEVALTEANRIDDEDPMVWAYLCLLSMINEQKDEFAVCYRQMIKNNLKCEKTYQLVGESMNAMDYYKPIAELVGSDRKAV